MNRKKDIIINSSSLSENLVDLLQNWNRLSDDCKENRKLFSKNSIDFAKEDAALNSIEWCIIDIKKLIKDTDRSLYRHVVKSVLKKKTKFKR